MPGLEVGLLMWQSTALCWLPD